jgi:peptidyl-tRNA hydrolase, PTH1 family
MLLIAALGNPGPQYQRHRHNVGFMVAEALRRRAGWPPFKNKHRGLFGEGTIEGQRAGLLLPMTFMNKSGLGVVEAMRFYKIPVSGLLVIHDEVELPFGEVRLKEAGGLGGHNGLRSIEQHAGSREFWRVRVGVGKDTRPGQSLADYVLSDFDEPEDEVVDLIYRAADLAEDWLRSGGVPA